MSHTDHPQPESEPLRLWRVLRAYIQHACALMGQPGELAQRLWLSRAEHDFFCALMRPLEALLRRLIFLDALALDPEPPQPETKLRAKRGMSSACGAAFDMAHPESWRTHFNLHTEERRLAAGNSVSSSRAASGSPNRLDAGAPQRHHINGLPAAPLALRLEALIRGFNDPAPLARRLARRLYRAAEHAPAIARRICARLSKRDARHPLAPPARDAGKLCAARIATALGPDTS